MAVVAVFAVMEVKVEEVVVLLVVVIGLTKSLSTDSAIVEGGLEVSGGGGGGDVLAEGEEVGV